MKKLFMLTIAGLLATTAASAQDLDTVSVVDQFSAGSRSTTAPNPSIITGADITPAGGITYFTTFGEGTAAETEVLDVTLGTNDPDGAGPSPAIVGNVNDTFSASPTFAAFVGDGGGGQNLNFGEEDDANYTITAAVYCEPHTALTDEFERIYISIRVPGAFDEGNNTDAIGGYGLAFESNTRANNGTGSFLATIWNPAQAGPLGGTATLARDAAVRTEIDESVEITTGDWYILTLGAFGTTITYDVTVAGGASIFSGSFNDGTFASGRASLSYREGFTPTSPNEWQSRFDYVTSNPTPAPPVSDAANWNLYDM